MKVHDITATARWQRSRQQAHQQTRYCHTTRRPVAVTNTATPQAAAVADPNAANTANHCHGSNRTLTAIPHLLGMAATVQLAVPAPTDRGTR